MTSGFSRGGQATGQHIGASVRSNGLGYGLRLNGLGGGTGVGSPHLSHHFLNQNLNCSKNNWGCSSGGSPNSTN